jgi:hypothetical protein
MKAIGRFPLVTDCGPKQACLKNGGTTTFTTNVLADH